MAARTVREAGFDPSKRLSLILMLLMQNGELACLKFPSGIAYHFDQSYVDDQDWPGLVKHSRFEMRKCRPYLFCAIPALNHVSLRIAGWLAME